MLEGLDVILPSKNVEAAEAFARRLGPDHLTLLHDRAMAWLRDFTFRDPEQSPWDTDPVCIPESALAELKLGALNFWSYPEHHVFTLDYLGYDSYCVQVIFDENLRAIGHSLV